MSRSEASNWASTVAKHMKARPSFSISLESIGGAQLEGMKEMAYVIAVNGEAYLQVRGGMLTHDQAIELMKFIRTNFLSKEDWSTTT